MTLGEEELFSVDRVSGSVLTLEKKITQCLILCGYY